MSDDVLMFFSGHPDALPLYEKLERRVLELCPGTRVEVRRTQIGFKSRYLFGCASLLPVKRKAERPEPYLTVTFGLDHPVRAERIAVVTEAQSNRWTHHVLIGSPEDVDDELMGWMREAYEFAQGRRRQGLKGV